MKLNVLQEKQEATIVNIDVNKATKNRLNNFGIVRGVNITLEKFSTTKSTIEVKVGKTYVSLRKEEAELIEVSK